MKNRRVRLAATLAASILLLAPARTQAGAEEPSPESVMKAATEAANTGRYEDFARATHPDARRQFRAAMMTIVEGAAKEGQAVQVLALFSGVKDVDALKKLDDTAFFAAYLGSMIGRDPALKAMLGRAKIEVLGHVDEGKDVAHVVYRLIAEEIGDMVLVATLRKDGPGWAMLLSGDLDAMVAMIKQRDLDKLAFPDPKAMQVQPLGRVLEGERAIQVVYRTITPFGASSLKKVNVLTVKPTDPGWKDLRDGDPTATTKRIKEALGL